MEYNKFCDWSKKKGIDPNHQESDDVVLVYMSEISKIAKPSTLRSRFYMFKSTIKVKQNLDISKFSKTIAFLKKQSIDFQPKRASVFTTDQVAKFMVTAPDNEWLLTKVILTFGIFGACIRDDLIHLNIDDVNDCGNFFIVFLRDGKTHTNRSFTITDDECPYQPCKLVRKYLSLRPPHMKSNRLFIGYRKGKCVAQHIGTQAVAGVSKKVAFFLKLEQPESYTGHSMRRS